MKHLNNKLNRFFCVILTMIFFFVSCTTPGQNTSNINSKSSNYGTEKLPVLNNSVPQPDKPKGDNKLDFSNNLSFKIKNTANSCSVGIPSPSSLSGGTNGWEGGSMSFDSGVLRLNLSKRLDMNTTMSFSGNSNLETTSLKAGTKYDFSLPAGTATWATSWDGGACFASPPYTGISGTLEISSTNAITLNISQFSTESTAERCPYVTVTLNPLIISAGVLSATAVTDTIGITGTAAGFVVTPNNLTKSWTVDIKASKPSDSCLGEAYHNIVNGTGSKTIPLKDASGNDLPNGDYIATVNYDDCISDQASALITQNKTRQLSITVSPNLYYLNMGMPPPIFTVTPSSITMPWKLYINGVPLGNTCSTGTQDVPWPVPLQTETSKTYTAVASYVDGSGTNQTTVDVLLPITPTPTPTVTPSVSPSNTPSPSPTDITIPTPTPSVCSGNGCPTPTPVPTSTSTPVPTPTPTQTPDPIPTPPNMCSNNQSGFSIKAGLLIVPLLFELLTTAVEMYRKLDKLAKENPEFFDKVYTEFVSAYDYARSVVCGSDEKAKQKAYNNLKKAMNDAEQAINKSPKSISGEDGNLPAWVNNAGTYIRWAQNMEKADTILSNSQADIFVDKAIEYGVYIRYDSSGHSTGNPKYRVPHFNVGGTHGERAHVLVNPGYLPKQPIPIGT